MTTPLFLSPWHSCLYGIGVIESCIPDGRKSSLMLADVVALLNKTCGSQCAFEQVSPCSSDNSAVGFTPELLDEYFLRGGQMFRPSIMAHINGSDFARKKFLSQLIVRLNNFGEHILEGLKEREIYELLMSFAFYLRLMSKNILFSLDCVLPDIKFVGSALSRIKNPFFYSRACGLLGSQFANIYKLANRSGQKELLEVVKTTARRFISDHSILLGREHDGVHGPADYIVFSCSILGCGLRSLEFPLSEKNCIELVNLYDLAKCQYENCMSVESKMSQYLFYRPLSLCFDENIHQLDGVYFEQAKLYLLQDQSNNPYDYLRVTYMLFQIGKESGLTFNAYQVMLSRMITRLERTCENIGYSGNTNKKYDNDILSFCYSYTLWHYLNDSDLGEKVFEVFEHLKNNTSKLSDKDFLKIYLTMTSVRNYQ